MCRHVPASDSKPSSFSETQKSTNMLKNQGLSEHLYNPEVSSNIISRLLESKTPFLANDNISAHLYSYDRDELVLEVKNKIESLLKTLVIDTQHDHNTSETAYRIAKMFIYETLRGRYEPPPKITTFPNTKKLDELIVTKAEVKSLCSHHFQNIHGWAWVGIIYGDRLMGLSKIHRIVDHFSRRPQIQEELVVQIADFIESACNPLGVGVVIKADHSCVKSRGVEQDSFMVSSVLRGCLLNPTPRAEFFELVKMSGTM